MTSATVWVNTDNVGGTEDGTSLANGYVTLTQALSSETADLTQDMEILCSGVTADTGNANTGMDTNGFTLTIKGNRSESDGFYDGEFEYSTSHYRMETSASFDSLIFDVFDGIVDGIQVKMRSASNAVGIQCLKAGSNTTQTVRNCRVKGRGSSNGIGIGANFNDDSLDITLQNNVVTAVTGTGTIAIRASWSSFFAGDCWITNNTIFDCETGIRINDIGDNSSSATCVVKNNAVADCADDWDLDAGAAFTPVVTHNGSDEVFGTSAQDVSPGTPEVDEWPDHWTDPNAADNSKDFNVVASGALDGNGTTGTGIPTTDILGNSRDGSTPSIGAFEIVAAGAAGQLLQIPHHQRGGFNPMHGGFSA